MALLDSPVGVIGVGLGAIGVIATPFVLVAYMNAARMEETIKAIDGGISAVFTSVAQCPAIGLVVKDCEKGLDVAKDFSDSLGTSVSYSSSSSCYRNHGYCQEVETRTPNYVKINDQDVYVGDTVTYSYYPPMVGWQMLKSDPTNAVPLYNGGVGGGLVRGDGKRFTLTPNS